MRKSTLSVAILALATFPTSTSLADDFSALLADLSFGDAPSIDQPLSVAEATGPVELKQIDEVGEGQAPNPNSASGFSMPGMLESDAFEVATPPEVVSAPQVALKDPIPASVPEPDVQVNLDAAFAIQDVQPANAKTPAQTVGHHLNHCDSQGCESDFTCMPHIKPNLPSSTLYQYFRSNPCYANVWDGYRRNCGDHHEHLHGECDCFDNSSKSHSWSSIFNCGRNDCVSCDGGCDR